MSHSPPDRNPWLRMWLAALGVWALTLLVPLPGVPSPRGGTLFVGTLYGFIPGFLVRPARLGPESSPLSAVLLTGVVPAVMHIWLCVCVAYVGMRIVRRRRKG